MPVPAPGTAELLKGLPIIRGGGGERLTPTGAALLAELAEFSGPAHFRSERVGYGAGTRDPKQGPPNLLRVQLGRVLDSAQLESAPSESHVAGEPVLLFEFNLDDATGEEVGHNLERLRDLGVLDVWTSAVQMKKGRPGVLVSGLIRRELRAEVERVVFDHSTTLGIRFDERTRTECAREFFIIELDGESVRIKRRIRPHAKSELSSADLSPEFDDLARLSRSSGLSVRELERRAVELALAQLRASD